MKASDPVLDAGAAKVLKLFSEQQEVEALLLPRLPEDLFVMHFLPLFKGLITDTVLAQELRSKWYILARHPQGEVNIIDNSGNVLYTTPSINYTKMFDPTKADVSGSFKDLISLTNQLNTANPLRAKQYLENNLTKKFNAMRQKGHILSKEQQRWVEIFQRYESKNVDNTGKLNTVGGKSTVSNITDDDLVDDE